MYLRSLALWNSTSVDVTADLFPPWDHHVGLSLLNVLLKVATSLTAVIPHLYVSSDSMLLFLQDALKNFPDQGPLKDLLSCSLF